MSKPKTPPAAKKPQKYVPPQERTKRRRQKHKTDRAMHTNVSRAFGKDIIRRQAKMQHLIAQSTALQKELETFDANYNEKISGKLSSDIEQLSQIKDYETWERQRGTIKGKMQELHEDLMSLLSKVQLIDNVINEAKYKRNAAWDAEHDEMRSYEQKYPEDDIVENAGHIDMRGSMLPRMDRALANQLAISEDKFTRWRLYGGEFGKHIDNKVDNDTIQKGVIAALTKRFITDPDAITQYNSSDDQGKAGDYVFDLNKTDSLYDLTIKDEDSNSGGKPQKQTVRFNLDNQGNIKIFHIGVEGGKKANKYGRAR